MGRKKLGEMLRDRKLVDKKTLKAALEVQRTTGDRLGTTLLKLELMDATMLAQLLAEQQDVEGVDPSTLSPTREACQLLSFEEAMAMGVLPLRIEDDTLAVAMTDPRDTATIKKLKALTGREIRRFVAPQMALYQALKDAYQQPQLTETPDQRLLRITSTLRELVTELEGHLLEQGLGQPGADRNSANDGAR
jgi:hypothetical protein